MRRAYNDYGIIVNDEKFIGISLGYDYCAEHEWGIKGIKRLFGIPDSTKKTMGVKNRTITISPVMIFNEQTIKGRKFAILFNSNMFNENVPGDLDNYCDILISNEKNNKERSDKEIKDNIITAWDSNSFGVAVMGDNEVEYLKEIHNAILNKNLTIASVSLKSVNPFSGTALSLLITDRIPQDTLDAMYYGDKSYYDLEDYEEKIGMKKIIEKYGNKNGYKGAKYFCACSSKWINYEDEVKREEEKKSLNTKYDIRYWVNYSDNDDNYGWYTVEEIKEWMTTNKRLAEINKEINKIIR